MNREEKIKRIEEIKSEIEEVERERHEWKKKRNRCFGLIREREELIADGIFKLKQQRKFLKQILKRLETEVKQDE